MPLNLTTGPVGSGKTGRFLEILDRADPGSAIYLVPSEFTAAELRSEYLARQNRPLFGDVFMSWTLFLKRLADSNQPNMSRTHLTLYLYHLLKSHKLRYFRTEGISMGIAREFANTIVLLKQNLIDPKALRGELATRGSLKENDLLTVYERYEREKEKSGIIDDGDIAQIAAKRLMMKDLDALDGIDTVLIDEFYTVSPGMRVILKYLIEALRNVQIWMSLPYTDNSDHAFAKQWRRNIDAMEPMAHRHESIPGAANERPTMRSLVARSPSAEVRSIVNMISQLAEDDAQLDRIGVVIRNGDDYLGNLLAECERYGFIESACPFASASQSPIIHSLAAQETMALLPPRGSVEEMAGAMMDALRKSQSLALWRGDVEDELTRFATSRNAAAVSRLESIIKGLTARERMFEKIEITRQSFVELIGQVLDEQPSWHGLSSSLPFAVRPLEIPPARPLRRAFIPHMTEGHIPQPATGRLFFGEMDDIGEGGASVLDEIFIDAEERLGREAALLHAIAGKTEKSITFTHSLVNSEGGEAVPSSFLDPVGESTPIDSPADIASSRLTRGFTKHLQGIFEIEAERLRGNPDHSIFHGIIQDDKIKDMIRRRFAGEGFSPTSLELYANCPFQFFAQKVLGLKPEEEITPEILPKDRGTIIHAVLERFYCNRLPEFLKAIHDPSHEDELKDKVYSLVDDAFLEHASLIGYASPSLDDYQRRAAKTLAWQVVKMEMEQARAIPSPLIPEHCEWAFGVGDRPPLEVEVPEDEPAKIKGVIDRVDFDSDKSHYAVVDYKTGRNVASVKSRIMKGLHLQLPLYVEAARRLLEPKAEPLGGLLIGVQQAEKKHGFLKKEFNNVHYELSARVATLMDDEMWDQAIAKSIEAVGCYAMGIRGGRFAPEPVECNTYCDYKDVCRYHGEAD